MSRLLENLEGEIYLNQSDEQTVANTLKVYLNFTRGNQYDKAIREEVRNVILEKASNKSYFNLPPQQNQLKPIGFNQVIHIIVRRLWDEEDFFRITKNPTQIAFISTEVNDLSMASVKLIDAQRYIAHQNVFPFIADPSFFSRPEPDKIRRCMQWIKNGNSLQSFMDRMRLVGAYVQTVYFAGQNLIDLAARYARHGNLNDLPPIEVEKEEVPSSDSIDSSDSNSEYKTLANEIDSEIAAIKIDYPVLIDMTIHHLLPMAKLPTQPGNYQEIIKAITTRIKEKGMTAVSEKHVYVTYMLLKEIYKNPDQEITAYSDLFNKMEEKLKISKREQELIFYLIHSDKDPELSLPLSDFVEKCITQDPGSVTESHVKLLRSFFSGLPKEVKTSQFNLIRDKIKAKMEDPAKKKMVDSVTELIQSKIREIRILWTAKQSKKV